MTVVTNFEALISGWTINGQTGAPAIISFSFPTAVPAYLEDYYSAEELQTFRRFNAASQDAARRMIEKIAEITGIVFLEVEPGSGDIKFMAFDLEVLNPEAGGFAYFPSNGTSSLLASDIFIHFEYTEFEPLLMHELLHALGLKHPFEGDVTLDEGLDNTLQTVMSYNQTEFTADIFGPLDLQALQYLYGTHDNLANFAIPWAWDEQTRTLYQTGTDASEEILGIGGSDFIFAGGGDDIIETREGRDVVDAGAGNDQIYFGPGGGIAYGGDGDDFAIFEKVSGNHIVFDGGEGYDEIVLFFTSDLPVGLDLSVPSYGQVTLVDVESVTLVGDDAGSGFSDFIAYQEVYIVGGAGDDSIRGVGYASPINAEYAPGQYRYYHAGAGNDTIYLGELATEVYLGEGSDEIIIYFAQDLSAPGEHRLEDFESGVDKLNIQQFHVWNLTFPENGAGLLTGLTAFGAFSIYIGTAITLGDLVLNSATGEYVEGSIAADTIEGGDLGDYLVGLSGDDILIGHRNDDVLDGGEGADLLFGGTFNDTYIVDRQDDLVFENPGEGFDRVISTSNYYLYQNVEGLTLALGAGDLFGVGNELDNSLIGNDGENLLLGGAGLDQIYGGGARDAIFGEAGNDYIYGEGGIDYLVGGDGNDQIFGGDDSDEIHGQDGNDTLYGGSSFHTDILVGGAGDDRLFGNGGRGDYDRMNGGDGNDIYYVDTGDDLTFEAENGGIDTVYANVAGVNSGVYLYPHVENLVLLDSTGFGVGNDLDNHLTGSESDNWLLGGDGDDWIDGGWGNDVLFGQGGSDTFLFGPGDGDDIIADFTPGVDKLGMYAISSVEDLQYTAEQFGDDLLITGQSFSVILLGVQLSDLSDADFLL